MEGARKGQSKQTVNVRHISHSHNHAMTPEQEKHYSELFDQLDVDGDGRIDTKDLKEGLIRMGVPQVPGHAQKLMKKLIRMKMVMWTLQSLCNML